MSVGITRKVAAIVISVLVVLQVNANAQDLRTLAKAVTSGRTPGSIQYFEHNVNHQETSTNSASSRLPEEYQWIVQQAQNSGGANFGEDMFAARGGSQGNPASGNGNGGGSGDASDPTNVAFHVMGEWEWQRLNNNEGNLIALKLSPFIPITLGQQKLLFNFEVRLPQYAGLTGVSHSSGIGDTRLKLFWLISTGNDNVRAVVPSFDAIAPTGDEDRGLGGGQWILMPNVVFALQPAKNWSMYPFFRYVHSDDVQTNLVPDLPLPDEPGLFDTSDLRGFNLEWTNVLQLEDAFFNWFEFTPDYFKNFTGDRSETFTMKYTAAKQVRDGMFLLFDFWHPVGGSQNNDYTFKIRLDWYPQTNGAKCRRCKGRGCGRCHRRK